MTSDEIRCLSGHCQLTATVQTVLKLVSAADLLLIFQILLIGNKNQLSILKEVDVCDRLRLKVVTTATVSLPLQLMYKLVLPN